MVNRRLPSLCLSERTTRQPPPLDPQLSQSPQGRIDTAILDSDLRHQGVEVRRRMADALQQLLLTYAASNSGSVAVGADNLSKPTTCVGPPDVLVFAQGDPPAS